jgi:hypothetical protein
VGGEGGGPRQCVSNRVNAINIYIREKRALLVKAFIVEMVTKS